METVTGQIEITTDHIQIMEVLADFDTYPQWSGFQSCEVRARDDQNRAKEVYVVIAMGPVNAKYTISIEYLPNNSGLQWSFVEGSGITNTEGEYRLEPIDGGTLVHYKGAADANLPMPGFMKRKLISEGQKIGRDKALKGLKTFVEARA